MATCCMRYDCIIVVHVRFVLIKPYIGPQVRVCVYDVCIRCVYYMWVYGICVYVTCMCVCICVYMCIYIYIYIYMGLYLEREMCVCV